MGGAIVAWRQVVVAQRFLATLFNPASTCGVSMAGLLGTGLRVSNDFVVTLARLGSRENAKNDKNAKRSTSERVKNSKSNFEPDRSVRLR